LLFFKWVAWSFFFFYRGEFFSLVLKTKCAEQQQQQQKTRCVLCAKLANKLLLGIPVTVALRLRDNGGASNGEFFAASKVSGFDPHRRSLSGSMCFFFFTVTHPSLGVFECHNGRTLRIFWQRSTRMRVCVLC
jgi:hypothetical protein